MAKNYAFATLSPQCWAFPAAAELSRTLLKYSLACPEPRPFSGLYVVTGQGRMPPGVAHNRNGPTPCNAGQWYDQHPPWPP